MSSLRNSVQRRTHRERAQPAERKHLGLLEKHKDYSLRAQAFNSKKKQLRALRLKAALRNPDEFFFGMVNRPGAGTALTRGRGWDGIVATPRPGAAPLSVDAARLLKTQDLRYVRAARTAATRQLARISEQGTASAATTCDRVVFFDTEADRAVALAAAAAEAKDKAHQPDTQRRQPAPTPPRLEQARERLQALAQAEQALDEEKAKMAKTATSGGTTKNGKRIVVRRRKR